VRDGILERARIRPQQPAAQQAGRRRPCWLSFRRGLRLASLHGGLRHPLVASRAGEPYQVRQPLVDQGHLTLAPRQDPGQH
jgi:hypothetical protein